MFFSLFLLVLSTRSVNPYLSDCPNYHAKTVAVFHVCTFSASPTTHCDTLWHFLEKGLQTHIDSALPLYFASVSCALCLYDFFHAWGDQYFE